MKTLTLEDIKNAQTNGPIVALMGRVVGKQMTTRILNEMVGYKTIEKELGIDLFTLFRALTQGFYVKSNDFVKAHYHFSPCLFKTDSDYERANEYIIEYGKDFVFVKDYGKTWALTKEELL